jgi:negative regulator of sigma E activity
MNRLEEQLRQALRRERPPDDLAARILARARAGAADQSSWWERIGAWLRPSRMRLVAVTALVLVAVIGVRYEQYRAEQDAGERAKQEVLLALHVAGSKIHLVQQRVQHLSEQDLQGTRDVPGDFRSIQ